MDLTRASLRLDLWIGRHHHTHIVTKRAQSFGQGASYVCQPSYLGKWCYFGAYEKNFQWHLRSF
jgi:hypothetical protein